MKFYGKEYAAKMAATNAAGNAWKRQEAAEGAANLARDRGDLAEYVRLAAISDALRVAALAASEAARVAADDFVYARSRALLAEVQARQARAVQS